MKFVFIFIILFESFLYTFVNYQKELELEYFQNQYKQERIRQVEKATLHFYRTNVELIFHTLIQKGILLKHLYKASKTTDEKIQQRERETLHRKLIVAYRELNKIGVEYVQFHFKDNRSFLRFHLVDRYGDDLSSVRKTVVDVNKYKKYIEGFEIGRAGLSYRFVYPLYLYNEHIGSVEMSISFDALAHFVSKNFNIQATILVQNDSINNKLFASKSSDYKSTQIIQGYSFESHNHTNTSFLTKVLKNEKDIETKLNEKKYFQLYKKYNHENYIITFEPLRDYAKKFIGYSVIVDKNDTVSNIMTKFRDRFLAVSLIITLLSFFIYTLKRKEKKLIHSEQEAQKLAKVKSEFLANMSHEIRTPLNGIIGISYLLRHTDLSTKQKEYVQKVETLSNSLLSIVNDILDFSKIEAGKLNIEKIEFNLKDSTKALIDSLSHSANQKNLQFFMEIDEDIADSYYGDELRIRQVLTNLISNAIKFTQEGFVKLHISKTPQGMIRFDIHDSGIGLKESEINKLFQSFSQADSSTTRKYGGTGLGLSISKQLVTLMGGRIYLQSKYKKGSTFSVEIPLQEIKIQERNNENENQELSIEKIKNKIKNKTILLAEDNKTNQFLIEALFEDLDVTLDIANNGQEAVDMYKNKQYDLILMDLQMPIMDGYEASKIITNINKDVIIFALSANVLKDDLKHVLEVGMKGHLSKPIDILKLFKVLEKYLS